MSTDAAISDQASAWKAMERASDNFGLCDPATGIHFVTGKKAPRFFWTAKPRAPVVRLRANSPAHCKNGHERTTENTRIRSNGWLACRACDRELVWRDRPDLRVAAEVRRETRGKTCIHGHEATPENTYARSDGAMVCKVCSKHNKRRMRERRAALKVAA